MTVTVTLKQYWLKPWQTTTVASLQTGSNPCTITAGSTLLAVWAGWDGGQIAVPTDDVGTFVIASGQGIYNGTNITTSAAYIANAAGGSHTITPQVITTGVGGQNGEIGLWIFEITNMPATAVVRYAGGADVSSSSQSWSWTSDGTPQVGDIAIAFSTYENSNSSVAGGLSNPPTGGWTALALNDDASFFIPTEICYQIVGTAGALTAGWSNTDANTTEHLAGMLVLGTSPPLAITSQPQNTSTTANWFANFSVSIANATGTAHYQWTVNGVNVGQDSSTLVYQAAPTEQLSKVSVVVTDDVGSITSNTVNLRVFKNSRVKPRRRQSSSFDNDGISFFVKAGFVDADYFNPSDIKPSAGGPQLILQTLSAAVSVGASVVRQGLKINAAALTLVPFILKAVSAVKSAVSTLSAVLSAVKAKLLTLTTSTTVGATVVRSARAVRTGNATSTAFIARSVGALRSAATSSTATLIRSTSAIRSAATSMLASLQRAIPKTFTASTTLTTNATRTVAAIRSAATVGSASLSRTVKAVRSAASTCASVVSKQVSIIRSASTALTASLTALKGRFMTLSASTALTASLIKTKATVLLAGLTTQGVLLKLVASSKSVSSTLSASLATVKAKLLTLSASISSAATLKRNAFASRLATSTITSTTLRAIAHSLIATSTVAGLKIASVGRKFSASTTQLASQTQVSVKNLVLLAVTAMSASASRAVQMTTTASTSVVSSVVKSVRQAYGSALALTAEIGFGARVVHLVLAASVTVTATLRFVVDVVSTLLRLYRFLFDNRVYRFTKETRTFRFAADQRTFRFASDGTRVFRFPFPGV